MEYTNSALATYTKLSPNHSGQRTHGIDRITPHCFVGQVTAERGAEVFSQKSRGASCNYVIGLDGKVALVVEEKNRSWCSSSNANDQRAITIECASDNKEPYSFNGVVYNRLIELCADICRRYGKSRLLWIENKNKALAYEPKADEMLLTVHRWFANKSCPGAWMYERMGDLAAQVTAILSEGKQETQTAQPVQDNVPQMPQDSTENIIWAFLSGKSLSDYAVAGIMGNLYAESGLKANNLQNSYNTKLGLSDEAYTAAVDAGTYTREQFIKDKAGYGLAQWTYWSRKQALYDCIKSAGASVGDLSAQLVYLWKELQGYKAVMQQLKAASSVREASNAIVLGFEKPADQSAKVQEKRAAYGQKYYDAHAGHGQQTVTLASDTPFKVRIEVEDLNIRKGAGTDTPKTGKTTGKGVFTIVETAQGKGSTAGWGKLKSGAGWVSLDYCTRLK